MPNMTRPESLDEAPCFLNTAEYKAKLNILIENPIRIRRSCSDLLTTEFPEYKGSFVAGRSKKKVAKGATDNAIAGGPTPPSIRQQATDVAASGKQLVLFRPPPVVHVDGQAAGNGKAKELHPPKPNNSAAITSKSTAEVDFVGDDYETVDLEGDEDFEKIEMDEAEMADWEEI